MKVLIIQVKKGIGDGVIYLPYIHAISKFYGKPVSILVKESSKANELLADDNHINEIMYLDRTKKKDGHHDGLSGFFKLVKRLRVKKYDKVFIFNGWTFASDPSLTPFDHAIYDLQLLNCQNV